MICAPAQACAHVRILARQHDSREASWSLGAAAWALLPTRCLTSGSTGGFSYRID